MEGIRYMLFLCSGMTLFMELVHNGIVCLGGNQQESEGCHLRYLLCSIFKRIIRTFLIY